MPYYLYIGLSEEKVDESCPNDLIPYEEMMKIKNKDNDWNMYTQGMYMVEALLATVGNMFISDKKDAHEFPKMPYGYDGTTKDNATELSEDNKKKQTDDLFLKLRCMQSNFEINQKLEKRKKE